MCDYLCAVRVIVAQKDGNDLDKASAGLQDLTLGEGQTTELAAGRGCPVRSESRCTGAVDRSVKSKVEGSC
jgi:hypothetical protein